MILLPPVVPPATFRSVSNVRKHIKRTMPKYVEKQVGKTVKGRNIYAYRLKTKRRKSPCSLFVMSGVHPNEQTTVAFTLYAMHYASMFSQQWQGCVWFLPVLNVDGKKAGNWRMNAKRVDLNRDTLRFTQPESRHLKVLMAKLKPKFWVDVHQFGHEIHTPHTNTYKTLYYADLLTNRMRFRRFVRSPPRGTYLSWYQRYQMDAVCLLLELGWAKYGLTWSNYRQKSYKLREKARTLVLTAIDYDRKQTRKERK